MECCAVTVNGLDKFFGPWFAKLDTASYTRNGLTQRARYLIDFFKKDGLAGSTVLEVGCGVGALTLEIVKAGAEKAVGVDASPAYITAAEDLAQKTGLQNKVEYRLMDFAEKSETVAPANIVILDRVVCCYPDMRGLVIPAVQHSKKYLALTYPRDPWWMRLGAIFINFPLTLFRQPFRFFLHQPTKVISTISSQGFESVFQKTLGPWQLAIFQRQSP